MTIHFGKRNPGLLTATSPGDTLYIPFAAYNDSGDSELLSGLAVTDIEVFKNGGVTPRATDSGYSLISDTGMYGNRVGLYRCSIQLFNTADDPSFYAAGSTYHVAIDAVTIDGKTVRFFPAVFEIGTERANVTQIGGDTGAADRLLKFAGSQLKTDGTLDTGTGQTTNTLNVTATATTDTGQVNNAVWNGLRASHTAAGSFGQYINSNLVAVLTDTGAANLDQGRLGVISDSGRMAAVLDTGKVAAAVWTSHLTRELTGFAFDTGLQQKLDRYDTGVRNAVAAVQTTVSATSAQVTALSTKCDTGVPASVWQAATRDLTTFAFDTGIAQTVWRSSTSLYTADTGSVAYAQGRLMAVRGDTGAAHLDQGRLGVIADSGVLAAVLDTGKVANAVWASHQTRTLTAFAFDTGLQQKLDRYDTGVRAAIAAVALTVANDTGLIERLTAIETKTNGLNFTVAGFVDANIQYVNDVQVIGTGDTGTNNTWRPA